ncbi:hypothetical protein [Filifactor villosus]|uniref:Lipoprotein n=1 Tax=Filifactor villosus TaxID=29374 RepID=A0ABV9QJI1_9FIRM
MKFGKKTIALTAGMMAICMLIPSCTEGHNVPDSDDKVLSERTSGDNEIVPLRNVVIDSGSYSGSDYDDTFYLSKNNGKTVNFWIKNKGSTEVVISINGGNERTINPDKSGHISVNVTGTNQSFYFNATSSSSTPGDISIDFRMAQH